MKSIWTDLLYLHGYLASRDALTWRSDTPQTAPEAADASKQPAAIVPPPDACGTATAKNHQGSLHA